MVPRIVNCGWHFAISDISSHNKNSQKYHPYVGRGNNSATSQWNWKILDKLRGFGGPLLFLLKIVENMTSLNLLDNMVQISL